MKAKLSSTNGAAYTSPGQRPGYESPFHQALKGRQIKDRGMAGERVELHLVKSATSNKVTSDLVACPR